MSIVEKLRKTGRREKGVRTFCLQTIRFKKLLENARAVLDLFADGREKVRGEYIFDRHYVVSLIDGVLDRLGMMVYDACVLAPEKGEGLYAVYDRHKRLARQLIDANAAAGPTGPEAGGESPTDDPEYRLLSEALQWFDNTKRAGDETVMGFIRQAFLEVLAGLGPDDLSKGLFEKRGLPVMDMGLYVIDLWQDALAQPSPGRTMSQVNSLPLRHLLRETAAGGRSQNGATPASTAPAWVAAVGEYQLSLQSLRPDFRFRLETLASGYESSDFIFIFTDRTDFLDRILPPGFHIEGADSGCFAWSLGLSAKTIEDALMMIGRNLLAEGARGLQH